MPLAPGASEIVWEGAIRAARCAMVGTRRSEHKSSRAHDSVKPAAASENGEKSGKPRARLCLGPAFLCSAANSLVMRPITVSEGQTIDLADPAACLRDNRYQQPHGRQERFA